MTALLSGALTVGIFAGLWAYGSAFINIPAWAAFLGWAVFYSAGDKMDGLKKGIPSCLAGVFWAWAAVMVWNKLAPQNVPVLCIIVSVISFMLVYESRIQILFSFVPGSFVGASAFFAGLGSQATAVQVAGGLVCGLVIGFIQQNVAIFLTKKEKKEEQIPAEKSFKNEYKELERESVTVA